MTWTISGQSGGLGEQQVRDIVEQVIQNRGLTTNLVPNSVPIGATLTNLITPGVTGQPINAVKTGLPPNPQDGEDAYYLASDTSGVVWHLRYRRGSASQYKWEFVGGAALFNETTTADTTTSATYNNPSGGLSTGPEVTVPLAGQYEVSIGLGQYQTTGGTGYMSYSIGAATAVDADAVLYGGTATSVNQSKTRVKTLAANDRLLCVYKTTANTLNVFDRWILARPVRVTG